MKLLTFFLFSISAFSQNLSPFAAPPFASDPATCYVSQMYYNTVSNIIKECITANTWRSTVIGPNVSVTGNVPIYTDTTGTRLSGGFPTSAVSFLSGGTSSQAIPLTLGTGNNTLDPGFLPLTATFVSNDNSTGTTLLLLAKINSSGKAVRIATTDTSTPIYVVIGNAGTTGSAELATSGLPDCLFDAGGATAGDFVVASTTTAGRCHDAGPAFPTSGWVIGQASSTVGANSDTNVILLQGDFASSGGGGGVSSIGFTTPVNGFTFTSSTTNPITSTGTITLGFSNENANLFFAGPCTGSAASPTWRAICYQDVPGSVNSVSFSATPNFDLSLGGIQTITLTGNVTSSTISNGVPGKRYAFIICQDSTGGRTFAFPTGFHAPMVIGSTASLCSRQAFDALNSTTFYGDDGVTNQ